MASFDLFIRVIGISLAIDMRYWFLLLPRDLLPDRRERSSRDSGSNIIFPLLGSTGRFNSVNSTDVLSSPGNWENLGLPLPAQYMYCCLIALQIQFWKENRFKWKRHQEWSAEEIPFFLGTKWFDSLPYDSIGLRTRTWLKAPTSEKFGNDLLAVIHHSNTYYFSGLSRH